MTTMTIKKSVFEKKLARAREVLTRAGLVAPDGSGESDVEALFVLLRWFEQGRIRIDYS